MQERSVERRDIWRVIALTCVFSMLCACGVTHIGTYQAKRRDYKSPVDLTAAAGETANGSIFNATSPQAYLFADQRAMRMGDVVIIKVLERADAKRNAETALSRSSEINLGIDAFFGLLKSAAEVLPVGDLLNMNMGTEFDGSGMTSRSENVQATVPAIVRQVLPNGNLFVEGHRVILVNHEEHHFYVSGVVRPVDIAGDNSVVSSKVADAEIEFTGLGVISEKLQPGWLSRGMDHARPL